MPERQAPSLRLSLVGMMATLFLVGMGALYLAARSYGQTAADRSFDRLLAGSALSIAETLSVVDRDVQVDVPYAALDMLSAAPDDRVFYRVFGLGSRTITGYGDMPPPPAEVRAEAGLVDAPRYFDADYRGERVRFVALGREVAEPGVNGWIWVQVGQTRRARDALAHELVLNALMSIAAITLLALATVWFGVNRALRPFRRVSRDLAGREPSDLQPLAVDVPAEMLPAIDALNGFMQRLELNMDTLRAFIAEAAHQMRTPLAGLRAQAQLALAEDDAAELRRGLEAVERNAAKLSRLLNQLLSDATVMHRSDMRRFETFDLLGVVRKALREVVPVAAQTEVALRTSLAEAPYTGDALLLSEALKNLVDNALSHGGGIDVAVRVGHDGGRYRIDVLDRGPGVDLDEQAQLFQRFRRGSSARPGVGLGLAIVRRAIESQGGSVTMAARDGGGLAVTIDLPAGRA